VGKTTLQQAAQLWADAKGAGARRALDDGMAKLAAMIAFDLAEAKRADGNPYDGTMNARVEWAPIGYGAKTEEGYVVWEPNGRIWVRFKTRDLSACGVLAR